RGRAWGSVVLARGGVAKDRLHRLGGGLWNVARAGAGLFRSFGRSPNDLAGHRDCGLASLATGSDGDTLRRTGHQGMAERIRQRHGAAGPDWNRCQLGSVQGTGLLVGPPHTECGTDYAG